MMIVIFYDYIRGGYKNVVRFLDRLNSIITSTAYLNQLGIINMSEFPYAAFKNPRRSATMTTFFENYH